MAVTVPEADEAELWLPPILRTVATEGAGVPELAEQITRHADYLRSTGAWEARERLRLEVELEALVQQNLMNEFRQRVSEKEYRQVLGQMFAHQLSPWQAVTLLLDGKAK